MPYHVVRAVEPGHGAHQAEGRTCLPGGGPAAADGVKPAQPGIGPVGARRRLPQHRRAGRPCAVEVPACLWGRRSWRVVEGGIQWQGASGWDEPYKAGGRRGFGGHFGGGVVRSELPTSRSGGGHGWVSGWPNPTTARTDVTRQPDLARGQDLEAAVRCHLTAPSFDSSFRRGRLARSGHGRHHAETLRCKVPWTARAEDSTRLLRHQAGTSGNR